MLALAWLLELGDQPTPSDTHWSMDPATVAMGRVTVKYSVACSAVPSGYSPCTIPPTGFHTTPITTQHTPKVLVVVASFPVGLRRYLTPSPMVVCR